MSVLTYIASDAPLPVKHFPDDLEVHFDLDAGTIDDGGSDDCFELTPCEHYDGVYTEKEYAVALGWHYYTEGRAQQVIGIIRENLSRTDEVEIWHLWMGFGEKPLVRSRTVSINELTAKDLLDLMNTDVFEELYEIPVQYRIVVTR